MRARRFLNDLLYRWFPVVGLLVICILPAAAQVKHLEHDSDGDGAIDRIAYVDEKGNPVRLEIDTNGDGFFR